MAKTPKFQKPTPEQAKIMAGIAQNTTGKPAHAVHLSCLKCKAEWSTTSDSLVTECPNGCPGPYVEDTRSHTHTHTIRRTLPRYVYHVSGHAKLHAPVARQSPGADSQQVPQAVPFEVVLRRYGPITRDEDMEALRRDIRNHVQDELKKADSPYLVGDTMIRGVSFLHLIYVDHDNENGEPARVL